MTNINRILKSRDITLPTKVHLVKAMAFPLVIYGCVNWTIKKAECRRTDAFELWCWRLLRVPWTARRSNQFILKEISSEYSLEGLMLKLKLQYVCHHLPEFTQTHAHRVDDAIQPSYPLLSPSPPAFSLFQHQSFPVSQFFASDGQSIGVLSFSISPSHEYSGLISFRIDWFDLLAVQGTLKSLTCGIYGLPLGASD